MADGSGEDNKPKPKDLLEERGYGNWNQKPPTAVNEPVKGVSRRTFSKRLVGGAATVLTAAVGGWKILDHLAAQPADEFSKITPQTVEILITEQKLTEAFKATLVTYLRKDKNDQIWELIATPNSNLVFDDHPEELDGKIQTGMREILYKLYRPGVDKERTRELIRMSLVYDPHSKKLVRHYLSFLVSKQSEIDDQNLLSSQNFTPAEATDILKNILINPPQAGEWHDPLGTGLYINYYTTIPSNLKQDGVEVALNQSGLFELVSGRFTP